MQSHITFKRLALSAACSLGLSACGGDSSSSTIVAPITTPVSVIGRITAFGSIYVNGVKYEINDADLKNDGPSGSSVLNENDLKIGMVVNLTGTRTGTTGNASSVSYNELIEAPVTNIAINASDTGTIVAGGKTVNISNTTVFYGESNRASLSTIVVGDWIEVSGYMGGDGSVDATMISYETESSHGNQAEFEGLLSQLDTTNQTFTLNGITVDYSTAIMPTTPLTNGMPVEVYGELDAAANLLVASYVEPEHSSDDLDNDSSSDDDSHEYELQGIISDVSTSQFTLAGVTVLYDNATRFYGMTAVQIQEGIFLEEVEGQYNAQGQFLASKIESFSDSSDDSYANGELEIESAISAIDLANDTITVMGYTLAITASTILKDDDQDEYYFNINSLSVGDYAEAVLIKNADNNRYSLRKLEREHFQTESSIEGEVTSVNADGSVMLGMTTVILPIGRSASVGQKIEVEGIFNESSQTFTASRIEHDD